MSNLKIYCVHPISGMSADEVWSYYKRIQDVLDAHYDVFIPMFGKNSLRTEMKFRAEGYKDNPLTSNHAIFERDRWMVTQADIILANLTGAKIVSIGSVMELAWASMLGKYVVLIMEEENIHRHAFVLEAADVIYTKEEDALDYLQKLAHKDF